MKSTILAAALALATTAAFAQGTGSEGYFTLHNDTEGNVLVGFYTSEDAEAWSDNWIAGVEIMPGQSGRAEFYAESGICAQFFASGWLGADGTEVYDDPISIDICEASNVYLGDNEITYD